MNTDISKTLIMEKKSFEQVKKLLDMLGRSLFDYLTIQKETNEVIISNVENQSIVEILKINELSHGLMRVDNRSGEAVYRGLHNGENVEYKFTMPKVCDTLKKLIESMEDFNKKLIDEIKNTESQIDELKKEELTKEEEFFQKSKGHKVVLGFKDFDELGQFLTLWEEKQNDFLNLKEYVEYFGKVKDTLEK